MVQNQFLFSAREVAILTVTKTLQGQDLQAALNHSLSQTGLLDKDKTLVTKLCYEYLRYKGQIDYILSKILFKKKKKLPFKLHVTLGLGSYEILYLEKVPEYASVNWYVEFVKKNVSSKFASLTNAVLRQVTRIRQEIQDQNFYRQDHPNKVSFLSRYYSCPKWIINIWLQNYGEDKCIQLLKNSLIPPPVGIRINQTLPEFEEVFSSLASYPHCLKKQTNALAFSKTPTEDIYPLEAQGVLSRQSLASLEALQATFPQSWPTPIWDACAGHGGKTSALLEWGITSIWISDIDLNKVVACRSELNRLRFSSIPLVFVADAKDTPPFKKNPHTIFLDVPCSGLGVLSRRPDIKWKANPKDMQRLLNVQSMMLNSTASILSSGDELIYMTCTLTTQENQKQIENLIHNSGLGFTLKFEKQTSVDSVLNEFFYTAQLKKK